MSQTPPFKPLSKISIVSEPETVKASFVVCYRVDGPEAGPVTRHAAATRLIKPCCRCGTDLYVSPLSPAGIPKICRPCVEDFADLSDDSQVTLIRSTAMANEAVAANIDYLVSAGKSDL